MGFLVRLLVNAVGLLIVAHLGIGVQVSGFVTALWAAFLWGLVNAFLKPVLRLLTLPLTILTLGLFTLVMNGFLLYLVSIFTAGFSLSGFWPAVLGAFLLSLVSGILSWITRLL